MVPGPDNPLASWFDRLVQCGRSDNETKCNGSHGGLNALTESVSCLGKFHPTQAIGMMRGQRGDHGCQAKARLLVVSGRPVQPHEMYTGIAGLPCRVQWVAVPPETHEDIGLGGAAGSVHDFLAFFC